jgi:valyl-tRNA synthetase
VLERARSIVEALARVRPLHVVSDAADAPSEGVASAVLAQAQVVLPLAGLIDLAAEREKLTKQRAEAEAEAARLSAKLSDEQFRSKAPEKVIARQEEMLAAARSRVEGLQARLNELG